MADIMVKPEKVAFHNVFLNSYHSLEEIPKKLLIGIAMKVQESKTETNQEFVLSAEEVCNLTGIRIDDNLSRNLSKAVDNLMKAIITIRAEDYLKHFSGHVDFKSKAGGTDWIKMQVLGPSRYVNGSLYITIYKQMVPLLSGLKSHYTQYKLVNIRPLKYQYSIRFYEVIRMLANQGKKKWEIKYLELKEMLDCSKKYKHFRDFKTRVLEPAKKELKRNCDVYFEYSEIRAGRSVLAIKFSIVEQDINVVNRLPDLPGIPLEEHSLELELRSFGWTGNFSELVRRAGGNEIYEKYWPILKTKLEKKVITVNAVRNDVKQNAELMYKTYILSQHKKTRDTMEERGIASLWESASETVRKSFLQFYFEHGGMPDKVLLSDYAFKSLLSEEDDKYFLSLLRRWEFEKFLSSQPLE